MINKATNKYLNKIQNNSLLVFLLFFSLVGVVKAQTTEQHSILNRNDNAPLDINSKAQELGISTEQLNGLLNSATLNGEGDPLPDALTERFFTGQAAGDQFGYSVASAGDVNGDGFDDIVIGAPLSTSAKGKVYLYFGGMNPDYLPDAIFSGIFTGGKYGQSVSSAGDVNADGFDDIIIGAPNEDATAGRAYIIFGNATMTTYSVLTLFDPPVQDYDDNFGISVSGAGDLNGDGYSDVIVGAPGHDINGTDVGAAFVFYGGSSMDANYDLSLLPDGPGTGGGFGTNVSEAGDINGDGYADVLVGAPYDVLASLYLGGASMNNIADFTVGGARGTTAGDLNGDGYSDMIVSDVPGAEIYFGGAILDNTPDVFISGSVADQFGSAIAGVGDVNGDGYDDVIIGAYNFNSATGRAYVYFGGETMDNVKDVILTGSSPTDYFGFSVSGAGDFNGDGYDDMLVGAPYNDVGGTNAGRAYLYLNSLTGADIPDESFNGEAINVEFGYSVAAAGDVNGDGYPDLIVGAHFNNALYVHAGRAYIYFGGPSMDNTADLIMTGGAANEEFGYSVSAAGDVNGDGYDDIIIGAPYDNPIFSDAGSAYIYFGGSSMDNIPDQILYGATTGDLFGFSVSAAGDVNADGYPDVIVGAPYYGGSDAGRVYIYYGGYAMDNIADLIITGNASFDYFGWAASTAGDVNGDSYADVIVGAPGFNSFTGRTYIYFGASQMDYFPDVIMTGVSPTDFSGQSVASAGDVNGDGYSDVIVGEPYNDAGGDASGRAYIYYGGTVMNNIADVIMTGTGSAYNFGWSVSSTGDVNGDSYSDVIIGEPFNNDAGSSAGRVYIYYGGADMDDAADVIMTGETEYERLGISVSTAGDINRDGLADVFVGAPYAGSNDEGKAYLYLSSSPPIKPRIISVKDVPFDQGGYVNLKWVRSGYDVLGIDRVTGYVIERSLPPGPSGFAWEEIANVSARKNPFYLYTASTWSDSMTNNSGTVYFRITAVTSNGSEFWRSNIMYGHSVDNLAPLPPGAFYAQLNGSYVHLGWHANLESDFRDYYIYRSDTPVGDALTLIGTSTDTTFIDNSPISGNAYYYIKAYDVHDNGSLYSSDSIMAFLSANIKVFLEGPYVGGQMSTFINTLGYIPLNQPYNTSPWNYTGTETVTTVPANVTDWILVELRSTETTFVDRRAAFVKNDGTLVDLDGVSNIKFPTATAGDYYVVINHRNHLSVMTKDPVTISFSPTLYDMTDIDNVYGTNAMKYLGGVYYGAYTADTDGSGTVNAADRSNTWNDRNLSGYFGTDVDLSGTVNAADRSSVWNNRNLSAQVPALVDGPAIEIVKENNN